MTALAVFVTLIVVAVPLVTGWALHELGRHDPCRCKQQEASKCSF